MLGYFIVSLHLKLEVQRLRHCTRRVLASLLKSLPSLREGLLLCLRQSLQRSLHLVVCLAFARLNHRFRLRLHHLRRLNELMSFALCLDCTHACVEVFQLRHDGVKQLGIRIHNNLRLEVSIHTHTYVCMCLGSRENSLDLISV